MKSCISQGRRTLLAAGLMILGWLLAAEPGRAQTGGSLSGVVVNADNEVVTDATVVLLELDRRSRVGSDGAFAFADVPPGRYYLAVQSDRFGGALVQAEVAANQETRLEIVVDIIMHSDEIVVSTTADPRHLSQLFQPVGVLSGDDLKTRTEISIGETLAQQPGVSSTYFGPGSSRPIIRGLGGDRVRILQDGVDSGDASSTSPDHAVSIDPLSAERIEIARGPATLLYGSNAIGGVVNVLSNAIPEEIPGAKITGDVELRGGSSEDERSGSVKLDGAAGDIAWHLEGFSRETDDYEIPDDAVIDGQTPGVLENSAVESDGGTFGLSYVFDGGFVGVSVSGLDTLYGIPGGHGHEEEDGHGEEEDHDEEEAIRIDLEQIRVDLKGGWQDLPGFLDSVRFRLGGTDYEHVELEGEGEEIGTTFLNDSWEARLEGSQDRTGNWHGSFGLQFANREFSAIGDEAFVPPTDTDKLGVFAFQELDRGEWRFQFGGRYETQDTAAEDNPDRSFDGISLSAGTIWAPSDMWSIALNAARAVKLPTPEELYSDGPHLATGAFESGDPDLTEEVSLGLDVTLRATREAWRGTLNLFANDFDDYIFQVFTGEEEDGLPVAQFTQGDALFYGAEAELHFPMLESEPHHLELDLMGDLVRAELSEIDDDLPRIPPARMAAGLRYRSPTWSANAEVRRTFEQDRVSELEGETPTDAFTMVNASLGYHFDWGNTIHHVELRGRNLTDEVARVHTSFLKDEVVLPGRDFRLSYRVSF